MPDSRIAPVTASLAILAAALTTSPAAADPVADFYRDKQVSVYVGGGDGGGYAHYARLVAAHMGRHIPGNPTLIVRIMQGGAGVKAANYLYNVVAQDGTSIGALLSVQPTLQLLGRDSVRYDCNRFQWLGRMVDTVSVMSVKPDAPATTLDAMKRAEVVIGASNVGDNTYNVPKLANWALGTKFKIVTGYKGSSGVMHAYQQGEVHGFAVGWNSAKSRIPAVIKHPHPVQFGLEKHPELPNVPLLLDLASPGEQRDVIALLSAQATIGRTLTATPGTPSARVAALRKAFDATMKDPRLIASVKKSRADLAPLSGVRLQQIIADHLKLSPGAIAKAKELTGVK